jgi:hypothetical protein
MDFVKGAEVLLLKEVQQEVYAREISCLQESRQFPKDSSLVTLSSIMDKNALLRVGGRLKHSKLVTGDKTPVIIPGKHHIATLLVRHYHDAIHHQGRHFTGAIRSAGYWITGGKRLINSLLHKCEM